MNLDEFIERTLSEILAGIRAAQSKDGGSAVGGGAEVNFKHDNLVHGGPSGIFTIVDFDVSVAADTKAGAKAGIRVLSFAEIGGGGERQSHEMSRVRFAIQVKIPEGEPVKRKKGFG